MDRRFSKRITIDLVCNFYVGDATKSRAEYEGYIIDMSEGGIKVEIKKDENLDLLEHLSIGDSIVFQTIDEYSIFHEDKTELLIGEAKIVRIDDSENGKILGCEYINQSSQLVDYINDKELSQYVRDKSLQFD